MNQVIISGNITADPAEYSVGTGGHKLTKFSIAVKKKQGEEEKTMYVNVSAWDKTGENIRKLCCKGTHVVVVGELEVNSVDDGKGGKRTFVQVMVREFYATGGLRQYEGGARENTGEKQTETTKDEKPQISADEEDMPF